MRRLPAHMSMPEVLLKIRAARESEEEKIHRGPMHMEQALAALHSLRRLQGMVSLEIGYSEGKIALFARTEPRFASLVENQIYAHYPDVDIENIPPNTLDPHEGEEVMSLDLALKDPHLFPIKRYPQFDDILSRITVDPLSGITSTLARYPTPDMRGVIQIVLRPIGDRYRKRAQHCLPLLNRGLCKKSEIWMKMFAWLYLARGWRRLWATPLAFLLGGYRGVFRAKSTGLDPLTLVSGTVDTATDERDDLPIRSGSTRSHDREDDLQAALDKVSKLLFDVNIRVCVNARPEHQAEAEVKLHEIAGSFKQFDLPHLNALRERRQWRGASLPRGFTRAASVLNTEEIATIWHLPNILVKTPNIDWVLSKKLEPPTNLPLPGTTDPEESLTILGEAVFRGHRTKFGICHDDRRRHLYIIGKTGMGKSVLLQNMIASDIAAGKGVGVIDPHGDLADTVLTFVPKRRTNDVIVFDPSDNDHPISFNILDCASPDQRAHVTSGLMSVFTKMWPDMWSGRMEHILRNTLLALIEAGGTSILGILRLYADASYRVKILERVTDPLVRSFWEDEFATWSEKYRTEALAAIQNKVGQLLSTPLIRNIVGQVRSTVDLRFAMDSGKIVVVNLSKGKLGEDTSAFLGSMLVTKFQIDAMSRADIPEQDRHDFYLYVDEFQNFATPSFATILSEARKYRLNLTMANQYLGQLVEEKNTTLKDAIFGNVGSVVCFQVGSEDAEEMSLQFAEAVSPNDILSLPKYHAYVRLMVSGMPSPPFSVSTLPPPPMEKDRKRAQTILELSRDRYAERRDEVERKIRAWAESAKAEREKQAKAEKQKEKEIEEAKKAKEKGMTLAAYRAWRDREMWTNRCNQLKKKVTNGEALTAAEQTELRDLEEKIAKAGGPTVQANLAPKKPKVD